MHTLRVLLALGPLALSFMRDQRRWLWWGAAVPRDPEFHQRRADRLLRTIVGLGPSFVKIAQLFATRADLIAEPYIGALGSLVDQVPALPYSVIEQAIQGAYGQNVDELFESFEREPVAAASLAQVHRAQFDGETVAVKVLRPGVEAHVAADVTAARRILLWLDRWWGHPHIKRELTALSAFEVRVREEVDFRQEAAYATAIRENFANNDRVIIPKVHSSMTRQRVMVMEFVEGTRLDRLDAAKVNAKHIVQTLVELYVQMELIDGLFHADPHPGNVMLAPDGRIVLVDFGAVVRVPMEMRRALVHTSMAAIRRDPDAVTQGFVDMGLVQPGTDLAEIRWISDFLIQSAYSRTTARERIDSMLADRVMKALFDSPLVLTEEAVYFGRAAALIEGIGTRYDPYFQIVPVASPVVLRMRSRILRSLGESVNPSVEEIATVAGYALGRAARWVTDFVGRKSPAETTPDAGTDDSASEPPRVTARAVITVAVLVLATTLSACSALPRDATGEAEADRRVRGCLGHPAVLVAQVGNERGCERAGELCTVQRRVAHAGEIALDLDCIRRPAGE
ncbi:MAG: AarF/UbiB family protein [Gemmatimonadetes bacterium]|nr:AarF/UbiB family protein [Gemmatimonadota bacterium]